MALTQRGINIPVTGQIQDGDSLVEAMRAQGMSTDVALGSAIVEAQEGMVAGANGVRRIIVSTDTEVSLEDGDLLLVLPTGSLNVTPAAPTFDNAAKTYTIPSTPGVEYRVGGVTKLAGVYSVTPPTTVTVTAHAQVGYTLTGTTSWEGEFTVTQAFTDFSEYTTGVAPSDWDSQWLTTTIAWTVEADGAATGGKLLRCVATGNARRGFAWTGAASKVSEPLEDVEIVLKWRRVSGTTATYLVGRGQNANASASGYSAGGTSDPAINNFVLGRYSNGSFLALNSVAKSIPNNTWHITRLQIIGSDIKARCWLATDPEPSTWDHTVSNTAVTGAGWVGIVEPFAGTAEYDFIGVGVGGSPAPTEAP